MKHRTLLIFFLSLSSLQAQQDPLMSLFHENLIYHNPAASGLKKCSQSSITGRSQIWNTNYPIETGIIEADMYISRIKSGIGLLYMNDRIGNMYTNYFGLNYSYQIQLGGEASILAAGLSASLYHLMIDYSKFAYFPNSLIPSEKKSQTMPDFDAGLLYTNNRFLAGAGIKHLTEPVFSKLNYSDLFNYHVFVNYYFNSMYSFSLSDKTSLIPSIILRAVQDQRLIETMLRAEFFNQKLNIGVSYRYRKNRKAIFTAGTCISKKLYINLAYDFLISKLACRSCTLIEANIQYRIPLKT